MPMGKAILSTNILLVRQRGVYQLKAMSSLGVGLPAVKEPPERASNQPFSLPCRLGEGVRWLPGLQCSNRASGRTVPGIQLLEGVIGCRLAVKGCRELDDI
jgi:hypothetical protein